MMAFSRIINCHTEEEYEKVFKKAGDDLVLVEFVAVSDKGWGRRDPLLDQCVRPIDISVRPLGGLSLLDIILFLSMAPVSALRKKKK